MDRRRQAQHEAWSGAIGQDVQDVTEEQPLTPAPSAPARMFSQTLHLGALSFHRRMGQSARPAWRQLAFHPQSASQRQPYSIGPTRWRMVIASLVTVALLVALTSGMLWLLYAPLWQVHTVRVVGTSDPVVIGAIQRLPLATCDIFRCDTSAAARRVEALPQVALAEVTPAYPNTLVVTVRLRTPALLWRSSAADLIVASDGVALGDPASDPALTRAPVTTVVESGGIGSASQITRDLRKNGRIDSAIVTMATQLREVNRDVFGGAGVLHYDDGEGFTLTAPTGLHVIFGTPADAMATWVDVTAPSSAAGTSDLNTAAMTASQPDVVTRAVALQQAELRGILAYLGQQGQQATVIDLRWGAHPYYRLAGA
ncbi:MAG: hypothetical protein ABI068_06585 [Ktedonobacterales bacterium]